MSENEKTLSAENVSPKAPETVESTLEAAACESAAAPCVETESPAVAIAEAAESEISQADPRRFHSMSKDELIEELRNIVAEKRASAHKDVAVIKQVFYSIRNKEIDDECMSYIEAGNAPESFSSTPDPLESELKDLLASFKQLRGEFLEAEEVTRQENLTLKRKIIEQLRSLVDDIDNINLHFPKFQQLQADFKQVGEIPASSVADTWREYQLAVEQFYDRLKMNKELRDLDFKKNLEAKQELIRSAKELENVSDVVSAFRRLQSLHDQWREIGPVAKDIRESIWDEFKAASTVINKRHQDFFENRKAQEKEAEEAKTALCEKIEEIKIDEIRTFAEWDAATKTIIGYQQEWKKLGFAPKKVNNLLFARFRKACDEFFQAKSEFFKKTREEYSAALARKTALCEKIESLREIHADDPAKALDEVVKLQAEWKKAGTVPRKNSDELWKRFSENCNFFFDQRKKELAAQRKEETANLASKREIIEKLREIPEDADRSESIATVRGLQAQWQSIGHVPFKHKDRLYADYREALDKLFAAYDIRETKARMSKYENQIDNIASDGNQLNREREKMLRVLDNKRNELRTYENNLGFFNIKSQSGNSMLKEMERKMSKIKSDIEEIKGKIAFLDEKMK